MLGALKRKILDLPFVLRITEPMSWQRLCQERNVFLYAGDLPPNLKQYTTHVGLTPFKYSKRTIRHDILNEFPISSNVVDIFQSEDVFEHIPYQSLPSVFEEIYRILKPGGLFRLSLPDYRFDVYTNRSLKDSSGKIVFDPGGGGRLRDGKVVGGGHLWFPKLELVDSLFEKSSFARSGRYEILHATQADGSLLLSAVDYRLGMIQRTPDHDARGQMPRRPISIIVDAWKGEPNAARLLSSMQCIKRR